MRIIHVASSYPITSGGRNAPFMEEMLSALAAKGHEVSIVVPRVKGLDEGLRTGVHVFGAPYAPSRLQDWGYGRSLTSSGGITLVAVAMTPPALTSLALTMRSRMLARPPEVVHLHWVLPQGLLAIAIPKTIPIVISIHGADARFFSGPMRRMAYRILGRADAVVAASQNILDRALAVHPECAERAYVIPHGANSNLFQPMDRAEARRLVGEPGAKLVLAVGRLVAKKGFESLLRSLPSIKTPDAEVVIVGEGPQRQQLEALAEKVGKERIHLVGAAERDELALWYGASDVVVIPSVQTSRDVDSGPVVLMEALAAGRPVIASRIGMAPDAIKAGKNGFLISSTEPLEIARAIDMALEASPKLDSGARRSFEAIGNWDRVAHDLETVYELAVERRKSLIRQER